jgi:hypothetical protein
MLYRKKYKLKYIWTTPSIIILQIDLTHPFEGVERIEGDADFDEELRLEYQKRQWKRIQSKRNPR